MPKLMKKAPQGIKNIYADGAYDASECRQGAKICGATALIPPSRNAVIHATEDPALIERNDFILEILGLGGSEDARKLWNKLRGYHQRSLGETAMFRFKRFFGGSLHCRKIEDQISEINSKALVMNALIRFGMPKGSWTP